MGWFSKDAHEVGGEVHEDATDRDDSQSTRASWPVEEDDGPYEPKADRFGWL